MILKDRIKFRLWLILVFIVRIVFAKRNFKVSIFRGLYFNFHGGFTSDQVALYHLTKENKKMYLSELDWYKSRRINYPNSHMLNDKLKCTEIIKKYVMVPKTVLKKQNNILVTDNNEKITIDEAIELIQNNKSCFFKPIAQGKGRGILKIEYIKKDFYIDYEKASKNQIKELLNLKDNYFISQSVVQADYLKKIYDKTSNTIRLVTARDNNNQVKVLFAVQRIGTKKTIPVDNGSRGGLVSKIDTKTGILSEAKSIQNNNTYIYHPDSNFKIKGICIPRWEEIKNKMIKVMKKLPQFKFIAWDILVTNDDFYILEANSSSGVNIIQVFGGERYQELGKFYKEQGIIK